MDNKLESEICVKGETIFRNSRCDPGWTYRRAFIRKNSSVPFLDLLPNAMRTDPGQTLRYLRLFTTVAHTSSTPLHS
jgi:hypothetical protein